MAAVEIALDDLLDDRPEIPILIEAMSTAKPVYLLEAALVDCLEGMGRGRSAIMSMTASISGS